jgi:putative transposase
MKKSRFTERQVIAILNEHQKGKSVAAVCRNHGISQPTFYQWRSKYSGMGVGQMKRVKELEALVIYYKKLVSGQVLDIEVLKHLLSKKALGPEEKRRAVASSTQIYAISVRRVCKLLGTHPSLILYQPKLRLMLNSVEKASQTSTPVHR